MKREFTSYANREFALRWPRSYRAGEVTIVPVVPPPGEGNRTILGLLFGRDNQLQNFARLNEGISWKQLRAVIRYVQKIALY